MQAVGLLPRDELKVLILCFHLLASRMAKSDMLVAQKFVENANYHELARELRQRGYGIENKPRGDFELQGISDSLIEKFSKRHQEIDARTRELLEREPEKAKENVAAIRENIAHKERARKMK